MDVEKAHDQLNAAFKCFADALTNLTKALQILHEMSVEEESIPQVIVISPAAIVTQSPADTQSLAELLDAENIKRGNSAKRRKINNVRNKKKLQSVIVTIPATETAAALLIEEKNLDQQTESETENSIDTEMRVDKEEEDMNQKLAAEEEIENGQEKEEDISSDIPFLSSDELFSEDEFDSTAVKT